VVADAEYCKDCGAPLSTVRWLVPDPGYRPVVAAVLSVIPGLGHLYRGRLLKAILWFFGVMIAYTAGPIGLLVHLACAANAALSGALDNRSLDARRRLRRERNFAAPIEPER